MAADLTQSLVSSPNPQTTKNQLNDPKTHIGFRLECLLLFLLFRTYNHSFPWKRIQISQFLLMEIFLFRNIKCLDTTKIN